MYYFDDVGAFHKKFELPYYGDGVKPSLLEYDVHQFRLRFMHEELLEYCQAYAAGDLAKTADALCDLVYVALGTAHLMRLPLDECWAEVQKANMTKVRAVSADDPLSKRNHRLDVVKPNGWKPPDIEGILEKHR